ncbi:HTH-type transcriptional regulator BenM [Pseudoruegeria aquimaris]|uniref:HTH-type transcriptional regulator BenM n=1 Tax=Pseudoruegeria aquimaris TaxID=393663 RepID=A0A1Y5SGL7_9RHOB|nr:LysR family transcriptional regulator [Pseudoruegeria aquimaris]SLN40370.1 HTH-type transcriptional regulator BenM [Pseudoruegeria aquimaris]
MRHLQIYAAIRAIVRAGSFRKASESLAISPSALNRQIKALEAEIGAPLFDRLPQGVRLSTVGEMYYRQFVAHLDEIRGIGETVSELQGTRIGHVRVAVSPELVHGFLQAEVNRFRNAHPGVSFEIGVAASDGFSQALSEGRCDLALILQPQYRSGVTTLLSEPVALCGVVPADAGAPPVLHNQHFLEHDVILPPEGSGLREFIDVQFKARRLEVAPGQVTEGLMRPHRATGRPTLQIWPRMDVPEAWRDGAEAAALEIFKFPAARLVLCRQEGRKLPNAAARFAAQLAEALQG